MDLQIYNIFEEGNGCIIECTSDLQHLLIDRLNQLSIAPITIKDNFIKIDITKDLVVKELISLIDIYLKDLSNIKYIEK